MDADQTLPAELSLDTALRIGRRLQPQLRQARAQTQAAEARVDQARAPLLPQVNLLATYSRATNNFAPPPGGTSPGMNPTPDPSFDTFNFFRNSLTATQLIWDFGQAWQRKNAARANAEAQEDAERATQLSADLAIRSAFYQARATRDAVGVAHETLANQNKHVDQIQAFTEVGTRPEIDLLQARTDQANAEVALINAQNDYATARAILNQTMGVEAPASYEVVGAASAPLPGEETPLETLVDEALRARPDVAAKVAQLRAQDLTNKATAGRYGPALSAATGLTYNGREIDNLVWNFSGGFMLAWPIFEGGLVRAARREGDAPVGRAARRDRPRAPAGPRRRRSGAADDRRGQGGGRGRGALAGQREGAPRPRRDPLPHRRRQRHRAVGRAARRHQRRLPAAAGDAAARHRARAATEGARPSVAAAPRACWRGATNERGCCPGAARLRRPGLTVTAAAR